jgi:putative transposase
MTTLQPKSFHPWSYYGQHCLRQDFDSDAAYWRYWADRLNLSTSARLRLEWMIFYFTVGKGKGTVTAKYFGIARQNFVKWKKRFNPNDLTSLEEHSRAPKKKRSWTVIEKEEKQVKKVREAHMRWGKEKLKREYLRLYGETISTNKIQKVITKHKLYPDPIAHRKRVKQARKRKEKTYINTFSKKDELGYLWHTDAIVVYWYGARRIIFTAIEELTKIAYARVYTTNSSRNAKDFLERLLYLSNHEVQHIHHDNGSEFAKDFEKACSEIALPQIYSRVHTPKDNSSLERFNGTIQQEWLEFSEAGLDDVSWANQNLTQWLIEYNEIRPHQSLDYKTPLAYATETFKLSPMWSASTKV